MDSISNFPHNEETEIIELEESFYFDQESLKSVWDESDKSLNMINNIIENLMDQETEMKKKIEKLYLNALKEQLAHMETIFQSEKQYLKELENKLKSAKEKVDHLPDLSPEQWTYIDQSKVRRLQLLPVRLKIEAKGESIAMQKGLVNFTSSSAVEQMAQITRNPHYPRYILGVASNSDQKSSTPITEENSQATRCVSEPSHYDNVQEYVSTGSNTQPNAIRSTDIECTILSAYEPNYWYVRLKGDQKDINIDKGKLQSMLNEMNCFYKAKNEPGFKRLETIAEVENEDSEELVWEPLHLNFKAGDFVALKDEETKIWNRGKILEMHDHQSRADVLLIDKGIIDFGIFIEKLSRLEEKFKSLESNVYCVNLADIQDLNLQSFSILSNIVNDITEADQIFDTKIFARFYDDENDDKNELLDVSRTSPLYTIPVRMTLRGYIGSQDPFEQSYPYQKDLSIYLKDKGLVTKMHKRENQGCII